MRQFLKTSDDDVRINVGLLLYTTADMTEELVSEDRRSGYERTSINEHTYFRSYSRELDDRHQLDFRTLKMVLETDYKLFMLRHEGYLFDVDLVLLVTDKDGNVLRMQKIILE